jgi:thioredoxin reductase (NADPH)
MSHYLVEQLEKTPNIRLRSGTEITSVDGDGHVERVTFKTGGETTVEEIDAVFVFIGTRPRTHWLGEAVLRDDKGFILTGRDLVAHGSFGRLWKERREPMALESSVPGIFGAGDARAGAMNRVASAVGEGSMVVRLVHDYLALT